MKVIAITVLLSAISAFGQGTINFNNRQAIGSTGGQAPVVAPIFGVDPGNPTAQKGGLPDQTWYNGPTVGGSLGPQLSDGLGRGGIPGLTYGGALLTGTGFTAGLWALTSDNPDLAFADPTLQPVATALFGPKTGTGLALRGYWNPPATAVVIPGVIGGASDPTRIKYQVRVWDNHGGTVTTWAQVLASGCPRGFSAIILLDQPLGAGSTPPPNLLGLESFQLYAPLSPCVPEPGPATLLALAAATLICFRFRPQSPA